MTRLKTKVDCCFVHRLLSAIYYMFKDFRYMYTTEQGHDKPITSAIGAFTTFILSQSDYNESNHTFRDI